jgi:hypothetical protein
MLPEKADLKESSPWCPDPERYLSKGYHAIEKRKRRLMRKGKKAGRFFS